MPEYAHYGPLPGVHLVAEHLHPVEVGEALTCVVTLQINALGRTYRKKYIVTGSDILGLAQQIANLMIAAAVGANVKGGTGFSPAMKTAVQTALGWTTTEGP